MMTSSKLKTYKKDRIQLQHNNKTGEAGTIDIFRGCPGCELKTVCYAAKGAKRAGIDFFRPIRRAYDEKLLKRQLKNYTLSWVRIGCISDPSLDWETATEVATLVKEAKKIPVVITKAYKSPTKDQLSKLAKANTNLQISVCGMTPAQHITRRSVLAEKALSVGIDTIWRIISAEWKKDTGGDKAQKYLLSLAKGLDIQIIDTPMRVFKTSRLWNHVDQSKYHRHLSPISGKLDNQRTAGLIIKNAFPCFSTCSKDPTENDKVGCSHQCMTEV